VSNSASWSCHGAASWIHGLSEASKGKRMSIRRGEIGKGVGAPWGVRGVFVRASWKLATSGQKEKKLTHIRREKLWSVTVPLNGKHLNRGGEPD